jgi:hypothetical protein
MLASFSVELSMADCKNCGVAFHPELPSCPVCGRMRDAESRRRTRFWFLINTCAVTFVAAVVLLRTISGGEVLVGMSSADCAAASNLAAQTRSTVFMLEGNQEAGEADLLSLSRAWGDLAANYTPGKYSWSTSGLEHNWLDRMSIATEQLAEGQLTNLEGAAAPERYVVELSRLLPRYCS